MRNQRRQAAMKKAKGGHGDSRSKTSITNLPNEILVMILSLLSVKEAVITSSVCKQWRFLWSGLTQLNFLSSENIYNELSKQVEQVNSIIRSYNQPVVHKFRIHFRLSSFNQKNIDNWLQFVVNKKVEILELNMESNEFPITLSNAVVVELVYLKKLCLNCVEVKDAVLEEILTRSPHLKSVYVECVGALTHIRVVGRHLNLKEINIKFCYDLESLCLSDFDLQSCTYEGKLVDLHLSNLPKLKEAVICHGSSGLDNVFSQMSSCLSSLQTVTFTIFHPKKTELGKIPQLPNVQKLTLIMGAEKDDCLLECASIAEACPNLETFIVELLWFSPIKTRRKARRVATDHPFENLKFFKILRYYSRISDLELASYVIDNAVALKKIVIDPHFANYATAPEESFLDMEKAARSSAQRQLKRIIRMKPSDVKLLML